MYTKYAGQCHIKEINAKQLHKVLEIERSRSYYTDPDFDVELPYPWALTENDVINYVNHKRLWVYTVMMTVKLSTPSPQNYPWLCGYFVVERLHQANKIIHHQYHPEIDEVDFYGTITKWLKANHNTKIAEIVLLDHQAGNIGVVIPLLQQLGWEGPTLERDFFEGADGWGLTLAGLD